MDANVIRRCAECGEEESSSPAWRGLHKYGPTLHDFRPVVVDVPEAEQGEGSNYTNAPKN